MYERDKNKRYVQYRLGYVTNTGKGPRPSLVVMTVIVDKTDPRSTSEVANDHAYRTFPESEHPRILGYREL